MSLPVHIEPEAHAELREAAHWYEAARPLLGVEFTLEVDRALERIAEAGRNFPTVEQRTFGVSCWSDFHTR